MRRRQTKSDSPGYRNRNGRGRSEPICELGMRTRIDHRERQTGERTILRAVDSVYRHRGIPGFPAGYSTHAISDLIWSEFDQICNRERIVVLSHDPVNPGGTIERFESDEERRRRLELAPPIEALAVGMSEFLTILRTAAVEIERSELAALERLILKGFMAPKVAPRLLSILRERATIKSNLLSISHELKHYLIAESGGWLTTVPPLNDFLRTLSVSGSTDQRLLEKRISESFPSLEKALSESLMFVPPAQVFPGRLNQDAAFSGYRRLSTYSFAVSVEQRLDALDQRDTESEDHRREMIKKAGIELAVYLTLSLDERRRVVPDPSSAIESATPAWIMCAMRHGYIERDRMTSDLVWVGPLNLLQFLQQSFALAPDYPALRKTKQKDFSSEAFAGCEGKTDYG